MFSDDSGGVSAPGCSLKLVTRGQCKESQIYTRTHFDKKLLSQPLALLSFRLSNMDQQHTWPKSDMFPFVRSHFGSSVAVLSTAVVVLATIAVFCLRACSLKSVFCSWKCWGTRPENYTEAWQKFYQDSPCPQRFLQIRFVAVDRQRGVTGPYFIII